MSYINASVKGVQNILFETAATFVSFVAANAMIYTARIATNVARKALGDLKEKLYVNQLSNCAMDAFFSKNCSQGNEDDSKMLGKYVPVTTWSKVKASLGFTKASKERSYIQGGKEIVITGAAAAVAFVAARKIAANSVVVNTIIHYASVNARWVLNRI